MSQTPPTESPVRALPVWLSVVVILVSLGGGGAFLWWYFSQAPGGGVVTVRIDPDSIPTKFPGTKIAGQHDFFGAVQGNDVARVKSMLASNGELAKARNGKGSGETPLHTAAFNDRAELATILLDAGADIEAVEPEYHGRPISWATYSGKPAMVDLLLARGAKLDDDLLGMAVAGVGGHLDGSPGKPDAFLAIVDIYHRHGLVAWIDRPFPGALRGKALPEDAGQSPDPANRPADPAAWKIEQGNLMEDLRGVGCVGKYFSEANTPLVRVNIGDADDRGLVLPTIYKVPVKIEVVAKVAPNNLRLYFADAEVILGWEGNAGELRYRAPGGEDVGVADRGRVPPDTFVTIVWDIQPDRATLSVDGEPRHESTGDYKNATGRVGIGPAWDATLSLKSIQVTAGK